MTRYRYAGPVMGLTLAVPDGTGGRRVVFDEVLVPGRTYAMPAHATVARLVAARRLTATAAEPAPVEPVEPVAPAAAPAAADPSDSKPAARATRRRAPKE